MNEAVQIPGRPAEGSAQRTPFWVILQRRRGGPEILTTTLSDGRRVLPVFSFEEEALLYARLGARVGSRARRTSTGELLSMLYGPCRGVELVALDPLPNPDSEELNGLVNLSRDRFVDLLVRGVCPARLHPSISPVPNMTSGPDAS